MYKRLLLIFGVLLLLNPVILYLITGKFWVSVLVPFITFLITASINKIKNLGAFSIIWINTLIVLSFLMHIEAVFTYRFSDYIIEDLYSIKRNYYFNRPNLDKTFQDKEYLVRYKTNVQGFRIGIDDDIDTRVEKCDWLFIGDSYTQGAQVEYEELFTSKLFDKNSNKIIVNAGISGLGIIDEYYYYINEGKKLGASKVFLQICNFNDFMKVTKRTSSFSDYLMHYSNFARYILYDFKYANPAELPLGRWTEPFYPDLKSNSDYNIFYKEQSKKKVEDLNNFSLYLKKFAKAVSDNGGELILLQIPTKEQISYKYLHEVLEEFSLDIDDLDMNYPNIWLSNLANEIKIEHIDLLPNFISSDKPLFFDFDEHLNIEGHQQVADIISEYITRKFSVTNTTILSKLNNGDRYPIVSVKSDYLFFQSWRDGNMELFKTDSIMSNLQRLTWNNVDELHLWPSPDGQQIVFTEGDQSKNSTKIAIMDIDGNNRRYINNQFNSFEAIPSYNHSGDKIAYAAWHLLDDKYTNPYIVVHCLETDEKINVTSDKFESWRPVFSPDDKKLFYISKDKNDQFDIYMYSFETKETINLTNSDFDEWDPCISNDGKKMIYSAHKQNNWDLFLLDFKTNELTQLTNSKGDEWDPSFSPCDEYVYYSAVYGLRNGIFKMKLLQ